MIIAALLTNPTIKAASEAAQIPESTIFGRLRKPEFKKRYQEAKAEVLKQATSYLQGKTAEALEIVSSIANDAKTHPQTRLSACRTILEYSVKFTETSDVIERIQELQDEYDNINSN